MNAAVDETSDQLDQMSAVGPGARLRTARLENGIELDRMAAQLHLQAYQVEALEQDNYDGFAARVFVRGYVRNYARLVNLPGDDVVAMFDAVCPDPEKARELRRVGSHKPQVGSGHGVVRMVTWGLLLGILALFLVWWAGYLELNGLDAYRDSPTSQESATPPTLPDQAPGQLSLPTAPYPSGEAEQGVVTPESGGAGNDAQQTEVAAPGDGEASLSEGVAGEAAPAAAVDEPSAGQANAQSLPVVTLSLSGTCWVQIRDSSNSYKLVGEFKAGTQRVLGGTPPYRILLGNASVAELTIDGQAVDLAPHTSGQVARFTLDPTAQ